MNRKELEKEFHNAILNIDYHKATKILGQMEAYRFTNGKYRYYEMLVLYAQKEYNKIRTSLQNQKMTWQERELYLASLAKLKQIDELERNFKQLPEISQYCYEYICYLLSKYGQTVKGNYTRIVEEDTYFKDLNIWSICFDLAEVYSINIEKLIMIDAAGDPEHIQYLYKRQCSILQNIRINDPYLDEIIYCVENNEPIGIDKIWWFPKAYLGNKNPMCLKSFSCLRDIVNYLNLLHKINHEGLEMESVVYSGEIIAAVKQNNKVVIDILSKIYLTTHYKNENVINANGDTFISVYKTIIQKHSPDFISFIDEHEVDAEIRTLLSPKGLVAYKAAVWQYDTANMSDYGHLDAGMLCLSYMRILELELNEKIIKPLSKYQSYFKDLYKKEKELEVLRCHQKGLSEDKIAEIKKEFDFDWRCFNNFHKGLELGALYFFLLKFRDKEKKYKNISTPILEILKNEVLTESGIEAIKNGVIADWINNDIRESYRNPPAHTRYVGLQKALDCRDYVLDKLKKLPQMFVG